MIIENADNAIAKACLLTQSEVIDYTVAPIFMKEKEKGAHEWVIEFRKKPVNLNQFNAILDEAADAKDYAATVRACLKEVLDWDYPPNEPPPDTAVATSG